MFVIQIPFLNLDQVYESNQSNRWIKVSDKKYFICHEDKIVLVQQQRDRFCFQCSEEEFYNTWYNYFDLGFDYLNANYEIRRKLKQDAVKCKGLRIINQNPAEVMVKMVCKNENEFYRLLSLGKKRNNTKQGLTIKWNEMPEPMKVLSNSNCFSKRIVKLYELLNDGEIDTNKLSKMKVSQIISEFEKLKIFDSEESKMICLYGLNKKNKNALAWFYQKYLGEKEKWV